jgi:hypothetical protein
MPGKIVKGYRIEINDNNQQVNSLPCKFNPQNISKDLGKK